MKKALTIISFSLFLTACGTKPVPTSFAPEEIYQGYPCTNHCEAFKQGYELAMNQQMTTNNQCVSDNLDVNTGCKAYLSDYRFKNSADLTVIAK